IINFDLSNGNFDADDFSGNTSVTIPAGQDSANTTITLTDDSNDEGDEVLMINMNVLPDEFVELNDNMKIRVVDNDFTVADFGTPLNPTFDIVESTQPNGYYSSLDGLSGNGLKQALQDIIADPDVVRAQTYADVTTILKTA